MKIRYLSKDFTVEEKGKEYIEEKLSKLEKILQDNTLYEVEISRDKKGFFRVEVMAKIPKVFYRAEETSKSIEASIDIVVDELLEQIKKDKEKIRDLRERGARSLKKKTVLDEKARF